MMNRLNTMRLLVASVAVAVLAACASMGRPEGGPRDEMPPVFMGSNPMPGALNVDNSRITLTFDENVQLDDPSNKIVISPAQTQAPAISSGGKKVTIELRDTMQPNTTYTIDLADAVKDLNEGNILDGLAIDFSTGSVIDTLRISGMVLEARTLEPAQGMLVGVYSTLADSAITTLKLERIAKTNQMGQFTVRNLKPGEYQIFAINDVNRDLHWDRSEDVAFHDTFISPSCEPAETPDTLVAQDGSDSIVIRNSTRFLPDDVLLTWFNEDYKAQYLSDYKRSERNKLEIQFGAKSDTLPVLTLVNGEYAGRSADDWALVDYSPTRDTLTYWITDSNVFRQDTMMIEARYLRTDTLQQLSWYTDTLKFQYREPNSVKKAREKAAKEKEEKEQKARETRAELEKAVAEGKLPADSLPPLPADTIPQPDKFLSFSPSGSGSQDVHLPVYFGASQPVDSIMRSGIHFEMQRDTVWDTIAAPEIYRPEPSRLLQYRMDYQWEPGAKYRLTIDSTAITGVYGEWNKPIRHEFTVKKLEDYSSLVMNVEGLDSLPAIAELLNTGDKPVTSVPVQDGKAVFLYVTPGTYYVRLFVDRNGNGEYDTGNMAQRIQPEEVYYYSKKLSLKKNWDMEQTWNLTELPVDQQKPMEIKKNKPKRRKGEPEQYGSGEEEDEFDQYYNPDDPFNPGGNGYGNNGYGNQYGNQYGSGNRLSGGYRR